MNSQPIPSSLRNLIADILDISPDQVTPELGVGQVEAWDSFGHLQMILAIEGEYGIQFDPQHIPDLTTVDAIRSELLAKGATL